MKQMKALLGLQGHLDCFVNYCLIGIFLEKAVSQSFLPESTFQHSKELLNSIFFFFSLRLKHTYVKKYASFECLLHGINLLPTLGLLNIFLFFQISGCLSSSVGQPTSVKPSNVTASFRVESQSHSFIGWQNRLMIIQ